MGRRIKKLDDRLRFRRRSQLHLKLMLDGQPVEDHCWKSPVAPPWHKQHNGPILLISAYRSNSIAAPRAARTMLASRTLPERIGLKSVAKGVPESVRRECLDRLQAIGDVAYAGHTGRLTDNGRAIAQFCSPVCGLNSSATRGAIWAAFNWCHARDTTSPPL